MLHGRKKTDWIWLFQVARLKRWICGVMITYFCGQTISILFILLYNILPMNVLIRFRGNLLLRCWFLLCTNVKCWPALERVIWGACSSTAKLTKVLPFHFKTPSTKRDFFWETGICTNIAWQFGEQYRDWLTIHSSHGLWDKKLFSTTAPTQLKWTVCSA